MNTISFVTACLLTDSFVITLLLIMTLFTEVYKTLIFLHIIMENADDQQGFLRECFEVKTRVHDLFNDDSVGNASRKYFVHITLPANFNACPKSIQLKLLWDCADFDTYTHLFNALVHDNSNVSQAEKFNHLKVSLDVCL